MRKVLPITGNKFPQKTFAVLAIIAFVAFLLTLKPIAEALKNAAEKLGVNFPALDVFRNVADSIKEVAIGGMLILVAFIALTISVKVGLILVAAYAIGYGLYRIYNTFAKGVTQDTLPQPVPMQDKK